MTAVNDAFDPLSEETQRMWQSTQTLLCPSPPPEQLQAGLPGWCLYDEGHDFCSLMFAAPLSVQQMPTDSSQVMFSSPNSLQY